MKLQDKIAIVTGAGGGIGRAAALLFAREGAAIAIVDIKLEAAQETAGLIAEAGGRATALAVDVSNSDQVKRMVAETIAALGVPTVLFNNAGLSPGFPKPALVNITEESFDRIMAVNLRGVWLGMKHVIPHMVKAGGGTIVNTASIAAMVACNSAEYAASKAGVLAMTRVAAQEYGPFNVRVNAICPGATATPMAKRFAASNPAGAAASDPKRMERMGVLGRFAVPDEMAKAALFLASDDSSYATGATFVIDGGWTVQSQEGRAYYTPDS
jgi:3-oxoacyl-[acyl-carrier protein] reductase